MRYSIIVPVFNRPDEVGELLQSLTRQTRKDFEVIIVEDGSTIPCEDVCRQYAGILDLHYYNKPNSGPGQSRNYGAERAQGEWLIILDSDVILPEGYLEAVEKATHPQSPFVREGQGGGPEGSPSFSAFGGPDRAHHSFTPVQKAISYAMTSFFTTGGIRGGKKKLDKFFPRSFNMGIRRDIYQQLGGFSKMRFGEDIDFSYRIIEAGHTTRLFPEAWVWHKRRTNLDQFFKQVYNSGIARINLGLRHPGTTRLVHALPALFTFGVILLLVCAVALRLWAYSSSAGGMQLLGLPSSLWWVLPLLPILLFIVLIFTDSSVRNRSLVIGFLSVEAAFVQLFGYGFGFLKAWWVRNVQKKGEFSAFEKNFYD